MVQSKSTIMMNTRSQTYSGCVKNLQNSINQDKMIKRWTNSVVKGVPFSTGKSRYVFLLNPQNGEPTRRVVLYGDAAGSAIKEGETLFVTGREDSAGIIIGERIYEPNSDQYIQAERVLSSISIKVATALLFAAAAYMIFLSAKIITYGSKISSPTNILRFASVLILAFICMKGRSRIAQTIGWILIGVGVYMVYPQILIIVVLFYVLKRVLR